MNDHDSEVWDLYAGLAMAAIISKMPPTINNHNDVSKESLPIEPIGTPKQNSVADAICYGAADYADRMMVERKQRREQK